MSQRPIEAKPPAWRNWYHIVLTPYGQWLPGDKRGWCERHHRRHVPGWYKKIPRPPEEMSRLLQQSKKLLNQEPALFPSEIREHVGSLILQSLQIQHISCLALSVGAKHIHMLIQCPNDNPRLVEGKCKRNVSRNLFPDGKEMRLWAKRCGDTPIKTRAHGAQAFKYILAHRNEGAWIWSYRDKN